jgi:ABC-2 type transport system permease protein
MASKYRKTSQFRALVALTKASLIATFRNGNALFFSFIFPFIFIAVFGVLGQGDSTFDVAIIPGSNTENVVYETLGKVESLELDSSLSNEEIDEKLNKGQLAVAIKITENEGKYNLLVKESAADPQNAQIINTIISQVVGGINNPVDENNVQLIEVTSELVEGRKFTQIDFILPGQLAFSLLSNALFGISLTIISLRKQLVIKRLFATPVKRSTFLLSEAISKIIIAILQSLLIVLVGHYVFDFTLTNGVVTVIYMLILSLVGVFCFLSFGFFVSALGDDEESVSPISNLIMMPQLFLSGAFFPIEAFPEFIQPIGRIMPMTFLSEAFKKVAFEGLSITSTLPEIGALLIWSAIMYLVVIKTFRWE